MDEAEKTRAGYRHREAFALMWYACKCGHRERIWNSRDGVTPFGGIRCPSCDAGGLDGGLSHVDWRADACEPSHRPVPGQRFWRDGTPDEAEAIMRKRIAHYDREGEAHGDAPMTPDRVKQLIASVRDETDKGGEFQKGWPMLDECSIKMKIERGAEIDPIDKPFTVDPQIATTIELIRNAFQEECRKWTRHNAGPGESTLFHVVRDNGPPLSDIERLLRANVPVDASITCHRYVSKDEADVLISIAGWEAAKIALEKAGLRRRFTEETCPGHVASDIDPKVCGRCGVHIDSFRPDGNE